MQVFADNRYLCCVIVLFVGRDIWAFDAVARKFMQCFKHYPDQTRSVCLLCDLKFLVCKAFAFIPKGSIAVRLHILFHDVLNLFGFLDDLVKKTFHCSITTILLHVYLLRRSECCPGRSHEIKKYKVPRSSFMHKMSDLDDLKMA